MVRELYLIHADSAHQFPGIDDSVAVQAAVRKKQVQKHYQMISPLKLQNIKVLKQECVQ